MIFPTESIGQPTSRIPQIVYLQVSLFIDNKVGFGKRKIKEKKRKEKKRKRKERKNTAASFALALLRKLSLTGGGEYVGTDCSVSL